MSDGKEKRVIPNFDLMLRTVRRVVALLFPKIPPTAVGGLFKYCLHRSAPCAFLNTPNGSWGIVQVLPKAARFSCRVDMQGVSSRNAARTVGQSALGVSASLPALLSH